MTDQDAPTPPPTPHKVSTPQPLPPQKAAKPAKPRKVEKRQRGRKG